MPPKFSGLPADLPSWYYPTEYRGIFSPYLPWRTIGVPPNTSRDGHPPQLTLKVGSTVTTEHLDGQITSWHQPVKGSLSTLEDSD